MLLLQTIVLSLPVEHSSQQLETNKDEKIKIKKRKKWKKAKEKLKKRKTGKVRYFTNQLLNKFNKLAKPCNKLVGMYES